MGDITDLDSFRDDEGQGISSARTFAILTECIPDDAVICVDVGNNAYSFGRYFEVKNQTVLMPDIWDR